MAKLKNMELVQESGILGKPSFRLDWDNDFYISIVLDGLSAKDTAIALMKAARYIEQARCDGNLT